MSDIVVDSSVVAKWILPETDSAKAQQLVLQSATSGESLIVLDLVFPEVANAIWKRRRQNIITVDEAREFLRTLNRVPVRIDSAMGVLASAMEIAVKYDRSVYDALFVALAIQLGLRGVTADEPLYNVIHHDYPQIILLRNL